MTWGEKNKIAFCEEQTTLSRSIEDLYLQIPELETVKNIEQYYGEGGAIETSYLKEYIENFYHICNIDKSGQVEMNKDRERIISSFGKIYRKDFEDRTIRGFFAYLDIVEETTFFKMLNTMYSVPKDNFKDCFFCKVDYYFNGEEKDNESTRLYVFQLFEKDKGGEIDWIREISFGVYNSDKFEIASGDSFDNMFTIKVYDYDFDNGGREIEIVRMMIFFKNDDGFLDGLEVKLPGKSNPKHPNTEFESITCQQDAEDKDTLHFTATPLEGKKEKHFKFNLKTKLFTKENVS